MTPIKFPATNVRTNDKQFDSSKFSFLIYLLRHATAIKNLENRHGGSEGTPLTEDGRTELSDMAGRIRMIDHRFKKIIVVPRIHCIETAQILGTMLGIPYLIDNKLQPINLGVLDNLSDEETLHLYPELAERLFAWRNGDIEIHELKIPEATDPDNFFRAGIDFLQCLKRNNESTIIVGTRSVLLLLASILLNRNPRPKGGYKEIVWPIAGHMVFEVNRKKSMLATELSNVLPTN